MRTLYDSTTVADIPANAPMVAGYVDGNFRTIDEVRKRFPRARIVTITVLGQPGANVCDTEPGNIGPARAAEWAKNEVAAGRHPTLYCMASQWDEVKQLVAGRGIAGKVSYWVAQYDGKPAIPAGAVAKQHRHGDKSHPGSYSGGHYDVSVVAEFWPGVDPKPVPPKPVTHPLTPNHRAQADELTRAMGARHDPLVPEDRKRLTALRHACDHALGVK